MKTRSGDIPVVRETHTFCANITHAHPPMQPADLHQLKSKLIAWVQQRRQVRSHPSLQNEPTHLV